MKNAKLSSSPDASVGFLPNEELIQKGTGESILVQYRNDFTVERAKIPISKSEKKLNEKEVVW